MSLNSKWNDMVLEYIRDKGEKAFWDEYSQIEMKIYKVVLGEHNKIFEGKVKDLAKEFNVSMNFFVGFIDGINESLKTEIDLDKLKESDLIKLDVDFEKLYFNMVDASADYLYNLEQWEGIFSKEKRSEIEKEWKKSKTVRNEIKVGRNDQCPCGSGKKYKKCCGK